MAASPGIIKALEGHHQNLVAGGQHEGASALLGRAIAELRGAGPPPSPGQRAAHLAAMGAEHGHDGGEGNLRSNKPGPAARTADTPVDIHGSSERSDHMSGTEPVPSRGQAISAMPGGYAGGTSQVRRIAAQRELSRRDAKLHPLKKAGENNKMSNPKGSGERPSGRVGNASSGVKVLGKPGSPEPSENTPARVGAASNPFARAGEQARQRFRQRR